MKITKITSVILMLALLLSCLAACSAGVSGATTAQQTETSVPEEETENGTKTLVVYFSATGNTRQAAKYVADILGADIAEIVPETAYTDDDLNYNNSDSRSTSEQNDENARPEIRNVIDSFGSYDRIIIGYPIWWGREPKIIDTFIESYVFSGKQVAVFCTSSSSGIEESAENIKSSLPQDAEWLGSVRFESGASLSDVETGLAEAGIN